MNWPRVFPAARHVFGLSVNFEDKMRFGSKHFDPVKKKFDYPMYAFVILDTFCILGRLSSELQALSPFLAVMVENNELDVCLRIQKQAWKRDSFASIRFSLCFNLPMRKTVALFPLNSRPRLRRQVEHKQGTKG